MKPLYMVFGGTHSNVGMNDFIGFYTSIEEAKRGWKAYFDPDVEELWNKGELLDGFGHIFDLAAMRFVSVTSGIFSIPFGRWDDNFSHPLAHPWNHLRAAIFSEARAVVQAHFEDGVLDATVDEAANSHSKGARL